MHHRRDDICNGTQQDMEEFHRLLLEVLEKELSQVGFAAARFINKYYGREGNMKKFLNTMDGKCSEGHMARTEEEEKISSPF